MNEICSKGYQVTETLALTEGPKHRDRTCDKIARVIIL